MTCILHYKPTARAGAHVLVHRTHRHTHFPPPSSASPGSGIQPGSLKHEHSLQQNSLILACQLTRRSIPKGQTWAILTAVDMFEVGLPAWLPGWVCCLGQITCCIIIMLMYPARYLLDLSLLFCLEKHIGLHSMCRAGLN